MDRDLPPPPVLDSWARALARVEGIAFLPEEEAFLTQLAETQLSSDQRVEAALAFLGYSTARS